MSGFLVVEVQQRAVPSVALFLVFRPHVAGPGGRFCLGPAGIEQGAVVALRADVVRYQRLARQAWLTQRLGLREIASATRAGGSIYVPAWALPMEGWNFRSALKLRA